MSHKEQLRKQRINTVINGISSKQEKLLVTAVENVSQRLLAHFPGLKIFWEKEKKLCDAIVELQRVFPDIRFANVLPTSSMKPDGGILYVSSVDEKQSFPILITEKKNQGTNDKRKSEGLKRQAKGNAIERLGKNVIGFRTWMLSEHVFPFVCFGDGCDFENGSSILDRVVTIAMFGELNKENVMSEGPNYEFNRGSFYFREEPWTEKEMEDISFSVAVKAVHYYFAKFGEEKFLAR